MSDRPVVLVTGGARGLGRAIAEELASDHQLCITYNMAAEEAAVFRSSHPEALCLKMDARAAEAKEVISSVLEHFGRLDHIVNNVGIAHENSLETFDLERAFDEMRVNAFFPMALISAASHHLSEGSSIVNISSINAKSPPIGALSYGASKAALENFTRGCAAALGARKIRVNTIAPGPVERDYAPRSRETIAEIIAETALRQMTPKTQIAETVRYLLSSASAGMTGEILTISSGYRL